MTLIDWRLFVFSATLSYSIRKASGNRVLKNLRPYPIHSDVVMTTVTIQLELE